MILGISQILLSEHTHASPIQSCLYFFLGELWLLVQTLTRRILLKYYLKGVINFHSSTRDIDYSDSMVLID